MLSAETIQSMGRKNVSVNAELTMQRTKEVLKGAKRKQKNEIDALTGLKRVSLNRVYMVGVITAKVAVAIGQVLNVDPFYLTGDTDERGKFNDETLASFLITKGYPKLVKQAQKAARSEKSEPAKAAPAEKVNTSATVFSTAFSNSPELTAAALELSKEDAIELLSALYIRGKAGGNAEQTLEIVKRCLLM